MGGNFRTKTWGRILVADREKMDEVLSILREIDADEVDHYMPEDFVAVYDPSIPMKRQVVYGRKFDQISLGEVTDRCWQAGIRVCCLTGYSETLRSIV